MTTIIGLCGRAGSGKSSVARYLRDKHDAKIVSLAGPLKRMAIEIFEFTPEQVYGEADVKETIDPRYGFSPRTAMQRLGQSARDHMGPDVWTDVLLHTIDESYQTGLVVIEDVRYQNEAWRLHHDPRAYTIRIVCEDAPRSGDHPSEAEVDQIPIEWLWREVRSTRKAGLDDLYEKIEASIRGLRW